MINSKCIIYQSGSKSIRMPVVHCKSDTLILSMSLLKTDLKSMDNFPTLNCSFCNGFTKNVRSNRASLQGLRRDRANGRHTVKNRLDFIYLRSGT